MLYTKQLACKNIHLQILESPEEMLTPTNTMKLRITEGTLDYFCISCTHFNANN